VRSRPAASKPISDANTRYTRRQDPGITGTAAIARAIPSERRSGGVDDLQGRARIEHVEAFEIQLEFASASDRKDFRGAEVEDSHAGSLPGPEGLQSGIHRIQLPQRRSSVRIGRREDIRA